MARLKIWQELAHSSRCDGISHDGMMMMAALWPSANSQHIAFIKLYAHNIQHKGSNAVVVLHYHGEIKFRFFVSMVHRLLGSWGFTGVLKTYRLHSAASSSSSMLLKFGMWYLNLQGCIYSNLPEHESRSRSQKMRFCNGVRLCKEQYCIAVPTVYYKFSL